MDTPWNRALGFPASLMRHAERMNSRAAQHRRAVETVSLDREVELPSGKIVRFRETHRVSTGDELANYLRRQVMPMDDSRDPRVVGA